MKNLITLGLIQAATPALALVIEQSTVLNTQYFSQNPGQSPAAIWRADQFDPALGKLTSVSLSASIINTFTSTERNLFAQARDYAPTMRWATEVAFMIDGGMRPVDACMSERSGPMAALMANQARTLDGQEIHLVNVTLTRDLEGFIGDSFVLVLLQERVYFNESWGSSTATLNFNLSLVYEYEELPALVAASAGAGVPDAGSSLALLALCLPLAGFLIRYRL